MPTRKPGYSDCPICAHGTIGQARIPYEVTFRNQVYSVPDAEVECCDSCGEVFLAPGQSDALQRKASDIARVEMDLLTGAEIVAFRKALGLTQRELELVMSVPAKTLARWEIGSVLQSRAADRFLRVLMAHPELVVELLGQEETPVKVKRLRPPQKIQSAYGVASKSEIPLVTDDVRYAAAA